MGSNTKILPRETHVMMSMKRKRISWKPTVVKKRRKGKVTISDYDDSIPVCGKLRQSSASGFFVYQMTIKKTNT